MPRRLQNITGSLLIDVSAGDQQEQLLQDRHQPGDQRPWPPLSKSRPVRYRIIAATGVRCLWHSSFVASLSDNVSILYVVERARHFRSMDSRDNHLGYSLRKGDAAQENPRRLQQCKQHCRCELQANKLRRHRVGRLHNTRLVLPVLLLLLPLKRSKQTTMHTAFHCLLGDCDSIGGTDCSHFSLQLHRNSIQQQTNLFSRSIEVHQRLFGCLDKNGGKFNRVKSTIGLKWV